MEQTETVAARLGGDWTIRGVTQQIDPLTALSEELDPETREVAIDCSGIEMIDVCGFQLLYTWLHCLQMRGFQPRLVRIPAPVAQSQRILGLLPQQELPGGAAPEHAVRSETPVGAPLRVKSRGVPSARSAAHGYLGGAEAGKLTKAGRFTGSESDGQASPAR